MTTATVGNGIQADASATVLAYHDRTKHRPERYAAGPETLDWDAAPDPFRRFRGAPLRALPLAAAQGATPWPALFQPGAIAARATDLAGIALLLELSFALSAWKQHGPDRWALRCTPSSGNLHPTEAYLLARGVAGLDDGLYHYAPREHALERRARLPAGAPGIAVGLSSLQWREAWKYGERAFRYCQLDIGHAIGALRYAAAVLGWRVADSGWEHGRIAAALGLDRSRDFDGVEPEEAEALLAITPTCSAVPAIAPRWDGLDDWRGRASRVDPHPPLYQWPAVDAVARASRLQRTAPAAAITTAPAAAPLRPTPPVGHRSAEALIRGRRSAQRFDRRARMDAASFWPLAAALAPQAGALPWDAQPGPARVHPVLFLHRVDGLPGGAYLLARDAAAVPALQAALPHLAWQRMATPQGLPLYLLAENPALAGTLRTLSCHQAIGADAVFVAALLADLGTAVQADAGHYRALLREAGLIGQALYLQAEAAGFAGTGIGCYFDDGVHELLGLPAPAGDAAPRWQVLYHFSVGAPLADPRIRTEPPYPTPIPTPP